MEPPSRFRSARPPLPPQASRQAPRPAKARLSDDRAADAQTSTTKKAPRRSAHTTTMTQTVTRQITLPPVTVTHTATSTLRTPSFASDAPSLAAARYHHDAFGYAVAGTAIGAAVLTWGLGRLWRLLRH